MDHEKIKGTGSVTRQEEKISILELTNKNRRRKTPVFLERGTTRRTWKKVGGEAHPRAQGIDLWQGEKGFPKKGAGGDLQRRAKTGCSMTLMGESGGRPRKRREAEKAKKELRRNRSGARREAQKGGGGKGIFGGGNRKDGRRQKRDATGMSNV